MESGPFRAPRPSNDARRVASREEPAVRQPQPSQPVVEEPKTAYRAAPERSEKEKKSSKKRILLPLLLAVIVLLLGALAWSAFSSKQGAAAPIDTGKYQAVFSTSGLVYFGKLESLNSEYFKLSKAYYLQSPTTGAAGAADTSDQKLIKLSDAIHGPEDEMIIPKTQVLFYENLKSDSKVAQAIAKDNP